MDIKIKLKEINKHLLTFTLLNKMTLFNNKDKKLKYHNKMKINKSTIDISLMIYVRMANNKKI